MKKDQLKVFIVACLVITVCAFGYVTYAFYQSQFSGTAGATLAAKWDFDFLGKDAGEFKSLKGGTYTINLGNSCTNCSCQSNCTCNCNGNCNNCSCYCNGDTCTNCSC